MIQHIQNLTRTLHQMYGIINLYEAIHVYYVHVFIVYNTLTNAMWGEFAYFYSVTVPSRLGC